jgi:hypothetical protein
MCFENEKRDFTLNNAFMHTGLKIQQNSLLSIKNEQEEL